MVKNMNFPRIYGDSVDSGNLSRLFAATVSALVSRGTGQHKKDDMKQNVLLAVLIGLNGGNLFKHISGILLPPGVGIHKFPQVRKATKRQHSLRLTVSSTSYIK